jgi:hypothetical protein
MGLTSISVALAASDLGHPSLAQARPASAAPARGPCGPEVSGPRPAVQILRAMGLVSVPVALAALDLDHQLVQSRS